MFGDFPSLPKYQCHKIVGALKIQSIAFAKAAVDGKQGGAAIITPTEEGFAPINVDEDYVTRHQPVAGGYFVVYEDGYESWSPEQSFESGYSKATVSEGSAADHLPGDTLAP